MSFDSEHYNERLSALFAKTNISRYARENGLSPHMFNNATQKGRKHLKKEILFDLCKITNVNPVLVLFSPSERTQYLDLLLKHYVQDDVAYSMIKKLLSEYLS